MSKRKEYRLTAEQFARLRDASKPVPYMVIGGVAPRSPRENAHAVWRDIGRELGFVWTTAEPIRGGDLEAFTAVPLTDGAK